MESKTNSEETLYKPFDVIELLNLDEVDNGQKYPVRMQKLFGKNVTILHLIDTAFYGKSYIILEDNKEFIWRPSFIKEKVGEASLNFDNSGLFLIKEIKNNDGNIVFEVFQEDKDEINLEKNNKELFPKEIKSYLDQYIVGQNKAKQVISLAIYNHYKRLRLNEDENDVEIKKSNIMMIGKSGSGKTLIASTVAKILDVPFLSVNATDFSPTGIVGKDMNSIIRELRSIVDSPEEINQAIVFIDEFDKLVGGQFEGHVVSGSFQNETQSTFLKLLEGEIIEINNNQNYDSYDKESFFINTSNILFICAGAFSGIDELIKKKKTKRTIGFNSKNTEYEIVQDKKLNTIQPEDLISFGLMPELVGRVPVVVELNVLTKEDLLKILTEPKDSIVKQYQRMFKGENIELIFEKDSLQAIVDRVSSEKIGARGLRTIVEELLTATSFEYSGNKEPKKCIVKKEHVKYNKIIELTDGNDLELTEPIKKEEREDE